jgi:hypothetical protein
VSDAAVDDLQARHKACGCTEIRSCDIVDAAAKVTSWTKGTDGTMRPVWSGSGTEIFWDSVRPAVPERPYWCDNCGIPIALAELEFFDPSERENDDA